ncbi:MAG: hypothetical protein EON95_17060 [Caulobacteraceae bacterium]|nr:hypothetical protein [Caulobacter sp.]RYF90385.1 MAG: hypothetical protein EON95_17060 [Caulobacteraceae bacterium]
MVSPTRFAADDPRPPRRQLAEVAMTAWPPTLRARVRVSPAGILAAGALLSGVLLSTAVLVWAAGARRRR